MRFSTIIANTEDTPLKNSCQEELMSRHYDGILSIAVLLLIAASAGHTQIVVDLDAIILHLEEGDEAAEFQMNIANDGDQAVEFRFRIMPGDLSGEIRRDDRGGPDEMEYEWRDSHEDDGPTYDWIDLTDEDQFEGVDAVQNAVDDGFYGMFELGFEMPYYGEVYDEFGIHSNGFATFVSAAEIGFFYPQWERLPNANPGDPANTPPPTMISCNYQDLNPAVGGDILYWHDDYMAVITWNEVPHFVDNDNQDPWTFQLILNADGLIKFQYHDLGVYDNVPDVMIGLQNEDRDLGFTVSIDDRNYLEAELAVAFGPPSAWVSWLQVEPMAGTVEAEQNTDVFITISPENLDAGYYYARLALDFSDDNPDVEIPVVLSYASPVGSLSGTVTDASNDEVIAGAKVNLNEIDYTIFTDGNGAFSFEDIPVGSWNITVTTENFNQYDEQDVAVADGEVTEVAVELLHGLFVIDRQAVDEQLGADENVDVAITAANEGNAPVTFTAERRLVGDANAEPWDLRRAFDAGQTLDDDRLQGVAFADDHFYVAGAAGDATNQVYILNRDGELVDQFDQAGEARYGLKDLAYDGELIWGSGDTDIFGYDLDGELRSRFRGPFNPTNNIAWDEDRGVLWCCGATTNIQALDREGNLVGQALNRRGLRIYGLAIFPEDPDGYTIYILNNPSAELGSWIHKMNPANGDTVRVRQLVPGGEPLAESLEISNQYDIYSWVILTNLNRPPNGGGDQLAVVQLDARKDWMSIDPVEGVVEADSEQEFTLALDATGLPEADFEGEILFTHNGRGGSVALPLTLHVAFGPAQAVRQIQLSQGWNLASINVQPNNPNVRAVTQALVDNGLLVMMKDGVGHFYRPANNFNNIPDWDVAQGYQFKVTQACGFEVSGVSVMADDPIQLRRGWQMVSYYPRLPVNAIIALAAIRDHLIVAKDGFGNFYLPAYNFNNMGDMREGRGYQMRVDEDIELVYQLQGQAVAFASHNGLMPEHFPVLEPTGSDMSMLIECALPEGEIGVYSADLLVGSGVIRNGVCGIAVRGDDPATLGRDGALNGDRLSLRLWDGSDETEAAMEVTIGKGIYEQNGLVIGYAAIASLPTDLTLTAIYPNPFNNSTNISFQLPAASFVAIALFDQCGRLVKDVMQADIAEGSHTIAVNASLLPSGVYFAKVSTPTRSLKAKLLLLR